MWPAVWINTYKTAKNNVYAFYVTGGKEVNNTFSPHDTDVFIVGLYYLLEDDTFLR